MDEKYEASQCSYKAILEDCIVFKYLILIQFVFMPSSLGIQLAVWDLCLNEVFKWWDWEESVTWEVVKDRATSGMKNVRCDVKRQEDSSVDYQAKGHGFVVCYCFLGHSKLIPLFSPLYSTMTMGKKNEQASSVVQSLATVHRHLVCAVWMKLCAVDSLKMNRERPWELNNFTRRFALMPTVPKFHFC